MRKTYLALAMLAFTITTYAQALVKGTPTLPDQVGSIIYDDGTNIGIGTTTPAARLDILGASTGTLPLLQATTSGSTYPALYVDHSGLTGMGLGASSATPLVSTLTLANEYLTTPASDGALLQIVNTTQGTSTTGMMPYSFGIARIAAGGINSTAPAAIDLIVDGAGLVGIGYVASEFNANGTHLGITDPDNSGTIPLFSIATNTNNSTGLHLPAMTVDYTGFVNIGGYLPWITHPAHLYLTDPDAAGTIPLLNVVTNQGEQSMVIGADGRVGMGATTVTSPAQLSVAAPAYALDLIHTGHSLVGNIINFYDNSSTIRHSIYDNYGLGGEGAGDLVIHPNPGVLDISGSADVRGILEVGKGTDLGLLQIDATAQGAYGYAQATIVSDANTKAFAVQQPVSGTATDRFVVFGDGHLKMIPGAASGYVMQSDAEGKASWVDPASLSGGLWAASGSDISNTNSGSVKMSGKVMIGSVPSITASSSLDNDYSLYVQKGIIAEKYKCALKTTSDWSDYVFDKGYQLKPLSDVAAYIKANKHLPDVPSAEEVHCEGIDIAKMDATLLRKIEELTLYTLELKKEIDAFKSHK